MPSSPSFDRIFKFEIVFDLSNVEFPKSIIRCLVHLTSTSSEKTEEIDSKHVKTKMNSLLHLTFFEIKGFFFFLKISRILSQFFNYYSAKS